MHVPAPNGRCALVWRAGCFLAVSFTLMASIGLCLPMTGVKVGRDATADKPQSKVWHWAGTWWCILYDGLEGSSFYRLEEGTLKKAEFPDALVFPVAPARADILCDADDLYVLMYAGGDTLFSKFRYQAEEDEYFLQEGFPVPVEIFEGAETAVLARDSRGVLWVTYESQGRVYVSHSKTGQYWLENAVIGTGLSGDDISSVVSLDDQLGIFWSNQERESLYFRVRSDFQDPQVWGRTEVVATGGLVADDHVNLAVLDGQVYAATKTSVDDGKGGGEGPTQAQLVLNVRSKQGAWKLYDVAPLSDQNVTRPIVVLDDENREGYVFYREGQRIVYKSSSLDHLDFSGNAATAISVPGVTLNNVTSTKQNVNSTTGLLVVATGDDSRAYHRLLRLR